MEGPNQQRRAIQRHTGARRAAWIAIGIALLLVAVSAFLWFQPPPKPIAKPPPTPFPSVPGSLGGLNGSPVSLHQGFLGVNARADAPLTPAALAGLNGTDVRTLRWPGGGLGDRMDPVANGGSGVVYNDSGGATSPSTTLAEFVQWCRSISCQSILTLPAEINSTATELAIVNYTERNLGFTPTYWEIGNEPAEWRHFGVPWANWNASQNLTTTPDQFAQLVQRFVGALRSVDTTTDIIGIGGIGHSAVPQSRWISGVVSRDGPNLSAVAIHVYPAGPGFPSSDLRNWFASLWGGSALPSRVPTTVGIVQTACPTCRLNVVVDEFQTGTQLTSATALSGGALATSIGAEIIQALPLPLQSLDYYNFESYTPGAWFTPSGASSAASSLYSGLAAQLGPIAEQLNVTSAAHGLLAAEGGATPSAMNNLLLVNSNTSFGFHLNLSQRLAASAGDSAWTFNETSSQPTLFTFQPIAANNWTIPPASLVIIHDSRPSNSLTGLPVRIGHPGTDLQGGLASLHDGRLEPNRTAQLVGLSLQEDARNALPSYRLGNTPAPIVRWE